MIGLHLLSRVLLNECCQPGLLPANNITPMMAHNYHYCYCKDDDYDDSIQVHLLKYDSRVKNRIHSLLNTMDGMLLDVIYIAERVIILSI